MTNYFHKGDVIQMRPSISVAVVRNGKAKAADSKASASPPCSPPDPGLPAVRRRSLRPLIYVGWLSLAMWAGIVLFIRWLM